MSLTARSRWLRRRYFTQNHTSKMAISMKKNTLIHVMKLNSQSKPGATVEAWSGNQKRQFAARPAATVNTAATPDEIRMKRMASGLGALCFTGHPPHPQHDDVSNRALRATTTFPGQRPAKRL